MRHGTTSGVSCETSSDKHVTPHLHREQEQFPPRDSEAPRLALGPLGSSEVYIYIYIYIYITIMLLLVLSLSLRFSLV